MSYSTLSLQLKCPICLWVPEDGRFTEIQCHFSNELWENFYLGDHVYLSKDPGYVMVRPWVWPNKLVVLEEWSCEQAHVAAGHLWARITIDGEIVIRAESVILSKEILDSVDAVTGLALFYFPNEANLSEVENLPPEEFKKQLLKVEEEFLEDQARAYAEIDVEGKSSP